MYPKMLNVSALCATLLGMGNVCPLRSAEVDYVESFKSFITNEPAHLVLKFRCDVNRVLQSTNTVIRARRGRIVIPKRSTTFQTFIRDNSAVFVGRSTLPLDDGFAANRDFSASAVSSNTAWSLSPVGQIAYDLDVLRTFTNHLANDKSRSAEVGFPGFPEIELLRNLCIDAKSNSLIWRENSFEGIEDVHGAPHMRPRRLSGSLTISNGLPTLASYTLGTNLHVTVRYEYTNTLFDISFPSQMYVERLIVQSNGLERLAISESFSISEVRSSLTDDDKLYFEPTHWINKPIDYSSFTSEDFVRMSSLASSLKRPRIDDFVSLFVRGKLSEDTLRLLSNYTGGTNDLLKEYLRDDFNRIIQGSLIYDPKRFSGVLLSSNTLQLLHSDAQDAQLLELNQRLLLICTRESYPKLQGYQRRLSSSTANPWLRASSTGRGIKSRNLRSQPRKSSSA